MSTPLLRRLAQQRAGRRDVGTLILDDGRENPTESGSPSTRSAGGLSRSNCTSEERRRPLPALPASVQEVVHQEPTTSIKHLPGPALFVEAPAEDDGPVPFTVVIDAPGNDPSANSIAESVPSDPAQTSNNDEEATGILACNKCSGTITGRMVHAIGKPWHPDCFRCRHCSQMLEHIAFYERDGHAYCGVDYDELFSLQCHHCHTPIADEAFVTLEDPSLDGGPRHFHQLHLFCAECGDPFVDPKSLEEKSRISRIKSPAQASTSNRSIQARPFVLHRNYPYCESCHLRLHAPKCWSCKRPLIGDIIKALGRQWHIECFVCKDCGRHFPTGAFFEIDGNPLCETCASSRGFAT